MNRIKRKNALKILKILKSGHSANNIFNQLSFLLGQPIEDINRIVIINSHWDSKINGGD